MKLNTIGPVLHSFVVSIFYNKWHYETFYTSYSQGEDILILATPHLLFEQVKIAECNKSMLAYKKQDESYVFN